MAEKLSAISLNVKFHWGYSVKEPLFTASQPAFRVPPPPTLIGALSYPMFVRKMAEVKAERDESRAADVLKLCPWATCRFLDLDPSLLIETTDVNRVNLSLGVRSAHLYPQSPNLWGVQPHGKIYAPGATMELIYFTYDPELVEKCAWGIVRIGTKESLVSVESVEVRDLFPCDSEEIKIHHLTPVDIIDINSVKGNYIILKLPELKNKWYEFGIRGRNPLEYIRRYLLPLNSVKVRLNNRGVGVRDSAGCEYALPKEVVGNAS